MRKVGPAEEPNGKVSRSSSKRVRFGSTSTSLPLDFSMTSTTNGGSPRRGTAMTSSKSPMPIGTFIRQVKRALRQRPGDYTEFAHAVAEVLQVTAGTEGAHKDGGSPEMTTNFISHVERIVSLLRDHPGLVAGIASILPRGFSVDVQPHAVVVKALEVDGDCSMIDTSHSQTANPNTRSLTSRVRRSTPLRLTSRGTVSDRSTPGSFQLLSSNHLSRTPNRSTQTSTRRLPSSVTANSGLLDISQVYGGGRNWSQTSPSRAHRSTAAARPISRRLSYRRFDPLSSVPVLDVPSVRQPVGRRRSAASKGRRQQLSASGGTEFLLAVKKALALHPDVYRKFIRIMKLYHEQRTGRGSSVGLSSPRRYDDITQNDFFGERVDPDDDGETAGMAADQVEIIREVVTLLRTRPQLVLAFNDFLPDGYRIRMFDESAYVIEHPQPVALTTDGGISAGIRRLTVTI